MINIYIYIEEYIKFSRKGTLYSIEMATDCEDYKY